MIELEKTFLARELPKGLKNCKSKEVVDVYFPKEAKHPTIRVRKNGDKYEMTKKERLDPDDASMQKEHTIPLSKEEFLTLSKLDGKKLSKIRYYYNFKGNVAEIDVFQGNLKGLVLIDFEFQTVEEKDNFKMPGFCLADVTQDEFVAGGMLCGKKYEDIEPELRIYKYKKIKVLN
jgi:CYTH domain-containing protein